MKIKHLMPAAALLLPVVLLNAAVIDFEDLAYSAGQWQETPTTNGTYTWTSGIATFTMKSDYNGYYWDGFKGSAANSGDDKTYNNDCASITLSGAGGSLRYAMVYANFPYNSYPAGTGPEVLNSPAYEVSFSDNVEIVSIALTNSLYFGDVAQNGNGFADPLSSALDGTYVDLVIRASGFVDGIDSEVRVTLAEKNNGVVSMFEDWQVVSLADLNASDGSGIEGLQFILETNFISTSTDYYIEGNEYYSYNLPTYFAFDDIVYNTLIPEPSVFAAVFGVFAMGFVSVKRRKNK